MATDDVRRRSNKKFSLLLAPITIPQRTQQRQRRSYVKYVLLIVGTAFVVTLLFSESLSGTKRKNGIKKAFIHHKFDRPNVITPLDADGLDSSDADDYASIESNFSRPFQYIGDLDPTKPLPWPKEETDWWTLHETLVQRVQESDDMSPKHLDGNYLPQLIFYGDSITEAWNGTSFGNIPGPTRMWDEGEPKKIRQVFEKHFGAASKWGERALLPPLILGISGSRTYDFIWRIENGEFPKSQLIPASAEQDVPTFDAKKLQRIYIVLMGTNNLGGGMLPDLTIKGMDATGRKILELHQQYAPNTPAAILFSELLPRKDDHRAVKMCPPRCANLTSLQPYESFMPAINKVNKALPTLLNGWMTDFPNSKVLLLSSELDDKESNEKKHISDSDVSIIRCGYDMFAFDNDNEFDAHMADRLHPNAKGYDIWAHCLKRGLEEMMDHTIDFI